ncbi:histidine kinase [Duganella sp. LX20W]|uniref:Histidine kinase n=1 Tax=Rugamonas brunnea TaxID=2758569 RepID=A0A7W2EPR0_9BURK|nr:histidine kinase [Rugamonas brunnea]MBA5636321.1 histidine kinase [Rugamonas brunnea]
MKTATYPAPGAWRYVAGAWLALALFDATQTVVSMRAMGMHHAWLTLYLVTAASWAPWAVLTPAILRLLGRFRLPSAKLLHWSVHGAACLAVGVAWATWSALLEHATNPYAYAAGPGAFGPLWQAKFLGTVVVDVLLYGAIAALSMTLEAHNRLWQQRAAGARLAELLAQAQLAALRLQIEPHFIFNALNAVTGLIREHREQEAIAAIAALGDLLRRVTDRSQRQFVSMEEEIDFLRKYLDIQRMRFAERLRYQIDIPDELMQAQVPDFIAQALVENAIKHGIARRAKGGEVRVSATCDGAVLTLRVANDGPPLPEPLQERVGLANTRQRLLALFGDAAALSLHNLAGHGVLATITLPYRAPA